MEWLKLALKSLWLNHRKKVLTVIIVAVLGLTAKLTGIPLDVLKDAARDAASAPAVVEPSAPPPVAAPLPAPAKAK